MKSTSANKLRSHFFYHCLIVLTLLIFFIGIPLFILTPEQAKNHIELTKNSDVRIALAVVFIGFSLALSIIYWILSVVLTWRIGTLFISFLFCWIVGSGFLFPLTTANGMFSLETGPTNWMNLFCLLVFSIVATLTLMSSQKKLALIFFSFLIGGALFGKITPIISELNANISYGPVSLSRINNIIVVSLDGIPGHMSRQVILEDPEYKKVFKDFTFYSNVVSTSPATEASLMGVVLGNDDYSKVLTLEKQTLEEVYFNDNVKYAFYTNGPYHPFNITGTEIFAAEQMVMPRLQKILELYKSIILRSFTQAAVQNMASLEKLIESQPSALPRNSTVYFDMITEKFELGSQRIGVVYMHFAFSHFPNTLDENCVYQGGDREWASKNQNELGIKNTTICAVSKYSQLVSKLKSIGAYDQSLIVFNSDHGKPANYYSKQPHNLKINNNPHWGYDRYRPTLMIKKPDAQNSEIEFDNTLVLLDDLAKTTCLYAKSLESCTNVNGVNLLDIDTRSSDEFTILVVKDEDSTFDRSTHMPIKISRKQGLLESLKLHDDILLTEKSTVERPLIGGWEVDFDEVERKSKKD